MYPKAALTAESKTLYTITQYLTVPIHQYLWCKPHQQLRLCDPTKSKSFRPLVVCDPREVVYYSSQVGFGESDAIHKSLSTVVIKISNVHVRTILAKHHSRKLCSYNASYTSLAFRNASNDHILLCSFIRSQQCVSTSLSSDTNYSRIPSGFWGFSVVCCEELYLGELITWLLLALLIFPYILNKKAQRLSYRTCIFWGQRITTVLVAPAFIMDIPLLVHAGKSFLSAIVGTYLVLVPYFDLDYRYVHLIQVGRLLWLFAYNKLTTVLRL